MPDTTYRGGSVDGRKENDTKLSAELTRLLFRG